MRQRETIFVVSRLAGGDENLLGAWGVLPPDADRHAAYLDDLGHQCAAESAALVLLQSSKALATHLHEEFAATRSNREATYILVHPGLGRDLSVAIRGVLTPREIPRLPMNLATHSFTLDSGSDLAAFLREIANYARRKESVLFRIAVALLRDALRHVIEAARGGNLSSSKARAASAAEFIEQHRAAVGLPARIVTSVRPVATISHRTLSRFDALAIDLQHSAGRADVWKKVCVRHRDSVGSGLSLLSRIVHGSDRVEDLHNLGELIGAIIDSGRLPEHEIATLKDALVMLRVLVPTPERTCRIGDFLRRVDLGEIETPTADEADAFRDWLYRVRTGMRVVGRAYDVAFSVSRTGR